MATFKAEVFSVQFIIHYCPVKNERIAYSYPLRSYLWYFFHSERIEILIKHK